ncbi:transcriptional regulator with XRE-family HTH domain [Actinokineospora baliensis]|uniref:helix-turn-helix domain-containing protein n=1 Tax=Actinokineospora baliensis TaxID=547056 RepID=UPI00195CBD96|nr:helix-turn-helix transcriptional regulator [Actinokineospora baliensis]MBM7776189.1 transcriptional regulator with XRE-family HTH domain [Actinokineospora baliensis]
MLSGNHKPASPKDRALGAELRAIRKAAGMSLAAVCEVLNWKESTLSRVERGLRGLSPESVMGLALIYKIPHEDRDRLIAWAKEEPSLGWWDRPPAGVPSELGALAAYEAEAIRSTNWSPTIIPGLLQTSAYASATLRGWEVPELEIAPRLRARQLRQGLLSRDDFEYIALIGVAALRNRICAVEEFASQLAHLHRLSLRDNVVLRIVEEPTVLTVSGWYLMDFDHAGSAVLFEHYDSSTFLFDQETKLYTEAKRWLLRHALSAEETRDRLKREIDQLPLGD